LASILTEYRPLPLYRAARLLELLTVRKQVSVTLVFLGSLTSFWLSMDMQREKINLGDVRVDVSVILKRILEIWAARFYLV
jgi:hypothetical protein